jgi:hypothetical protein
MSYDQTTADLLRENQQLRTMCAVAHAGSALYKDDGELQDSRAIPFIDWRRDSVDEIRRKLGERATRSIQPA